MINISWNAVAESLFLPEPAAAPKISGAQTYATKSRLNSCCNTE